MLHIAMVLICVTVAFEPVVGYNSLPWETGLVQYLGDHSLPSPGFLRYLFIDQPESEG